VRDESIIDMDIILRTNLTGEEITRFWAKVERAEGCWLWRASLSPDGYGKFSVRRGAHIPTFRAHRLAFYLTFGQIDDRLLICHSCDNRICVNPKHLFEGTVRDNALDMLQKGRAATARGEQLSDLSEKLVQEIRRRVAAGEKQMDLSRELKLGKNQIWHIVNNTTWKHLSNSTVAAEQ
jgi:hypothetical protein